MSDSVFNSTTACTDCKWKPKTYDAYFEEIEEECRQHTTKYPNHVVFFFGSISKRFFRGEETSKEFLKRLKKTQNKKEVK